MIQGESSQVEWRSNGRGEMIAFEDNQALVSICEDPQVEAQNWVKSLSLSADPRLIAVIGIGSGFHLQALAEAFPFSEIVAIDCRMSLIGFTRRRLKNVEYIQVNRIEDLAFHFRAHELMSAQTPKLVFKPALGSQAKFLGEIFYFLNIRTLEGLATYLGREVKGPDDVLLNLRQFFQYVKPDELPYQLSETLILKEIIR